MTFCSYVPGVNKSCHRSLYTLHKLSTDKRLAHQWSILNETMQSTHPSSVTHLQTKHKLHNMLNFKTIPALFCYLTLRHFNFSCRHPEIYSFLQNTSGSMFYFTTVNHTLAITDVNCDNILLKANKRYPIIIKKGSGRGPVPSTHIFHHKKFCLNLGTL